MNKICLSSPIFENAEEDEYTMITSGKARSPKLKSSLKNTKRAASEDDIRKTQTNILSSELEVLSTKLEMYMEKLKNNKSET